jgi:transcriptional regulator with XRE-family HTH domain
MMPKSTQAPDVAPITEGMARRGRFDADAFYAALDGVRDHRKLTWKTVAAQSGVSASTLTRMAQGKRPDVDGLAALVSWSGLDTKDFVRSDHDGHEDPGTLAMISTYLRSDRNLSPEAAVALEELVKATYERLRKD